MSVVEQTTPVPYGFDMDGGFVAALRKTSRWPKDNPVDETSWKCIFKRADGDTSAGGLSLFKQKPQSKSKNVAKGRSGSEQGQKCVSGTANKKPLNKKKKERKQNKEKTHW